MANKEFHSFKPIPIFKKELTINKRFIKDRLITYSPPLKSKVTITIESDYPIEVFDSPKYYVLYFYYSKEDRKLKKQCIGVGQTFNELYESTLRWKDNSVFYRYFEKEFQIALDYLQEMISQGDRYEKIFNS